MSDMPPATAFTSAGLASLYAAMVPSLSCAPVVDVEVITAAAYRDGRAAGIIEAQVQLADERATLMSARAAFIAATVVDGDALRSVFLNLVSSLARTVIAAELKLDPALMARLVDTALAAVATAEGVIVRAHPEDAHHLDNGVVADAAIKRGAVVVEGASFVVADGLDARLAALIETLL